MFHLFVACLKAPSHFVGLNCRCRENGNTPKHKSEESLYSTKVVVGTTRSKRLVSTPTNFRTDLVFDPSLYVQVKFYMLVDRSIT